MLDQVKAALDVGKEVPTAVGYSVLGPIQFPLPIEIRNRLVGELADELDALTFAVVTVHNYSSTSLRKVRLLFIGQWGFTPTFVFRRRSDVTVKSQLLPEEKEIIIDEIPPKRIDFCRDL